MEHLSSPPVFSEVRVTRFLVLCVCFVDRCLHFFFWLLCCLFFDIRILITPLVSSNSSYNFIGDVIMCLIYHWLIIVRISQSVWWKANVYKVLSSTPLHWLKSTSSTLVAIVIYCIHVGRCNCQVQHYLEYTRWQRPFKIVYYRFIERIWPAIPFWSRARFMYARFRIREELRVSIGVAVGWENINACSPS